MKDFLMSVKNKDGSFHMHFGGEIDVRGAYCALSVAKMLNLLDDELTENVAEFICRHELHFCVRLFTL